MEISQKFGEQIKNIRKSHKFTQIQFAKILNISQGNLSEIESGKLDPSLEIVIILCKDFNFDFNGFINQLDERTPLLLDKSETQIIYGYRQLQDEAKDEIVDYLQLKLKRYSK